MTERGENEDLPFFGRPPVREPRRVTEVPAVRGKRVILSRPYGFVYDMRAASEVYQDDDGRRVVDVVSEEHWFRWMFAGHVPVRATYDARVVWAE